MHMTIVAIAYATDKTRALSKAEDVFERLVRNEVFDEFTLLDKEGFAASPSWPSRWGKHPMVVMASSKDGKRLIEEQWQATKRAFAEAITMVREGINNYTDDELFTDKVAVDGMPGMFRYWCSLVGRTAGQNIFLYDDDAEGIRTEDHLANALNKWRCLHEDEGKINPNADKEVWVVPADVHF